MPFKNNLFIGAREGQYNCSLYYIGAFELEFVEFFSIPLQFATY